MCRSSFPKSLAALVLMAWTLVGCTTLSGPPEGSPTTSGQVYMLRGLFNIFSLGMDTMGQDLRDHDVFVEVHSGPSWRRVAKNITADREQGAKTGPLVISGHSWGADDAVRLARRLGKNGVLVDGLVLVDPTTPPKIPANVRLCVNFYRSRPSTDWMPWLRGVAVEAESPSTEIVNYDLRASETHPDLAGEINHFTIEANPEVQEMVVAAVLRILEQGNDEAEQVLTRSMGGLE
jgi:pimeloyl-ACP methyl ester carboxylesterase